MNDPLPTPHAGVSRRRFLLASSAAGLTLTLGGVRPAQAAAARAIRPLCIFSKHLQWLDWSAAAELAAEAGCDGVDLAVRPAGHVLPEHVTRDLPRAIQAVQRAGLDCPMITTAVVDAADETSERVVRTAADLGVRCYRMGYLRYSDQTGIAQTLESLKPRMAALAALNEKAGIHGAYQNHAGTNVGGVVWDIWELIRDLDPRWIGCQYDIRHATVEGATAWPVTLKLLLPFIRCLALKDFRWGEKNGRSAVINCPLGDGVVDFDAFFKIVNRAGVTGPVSLHLEYDLPGPELSEAERKRATLEVLRRDVNAAKPYLARAP